MEKTIAALYLNIALNLLTLRQNPTRSLMSHTMTFPFNCPLLSTLQLSCYREFYLLLMEMKAEG